jgi:hypothetical protein
MTGEDILKTRDALKAQRNPLEGHWDELSELFMPFRLMDVNGLPDILSAEQSFDSTPKRAALILANGLASLVTPREEIWFEFQPPKALRADDDAVRFYRTASETAREAIEASNFYEEIQESYIESPVYGTTALFCGDLDGAGELYFRHQPIKTYLIGEDAKGKVNCIYRDLSLTADQAAEEFGRDKLPPEIANKLGTATAKTERFAFVHAVHKRDEEPAEDAPESAKKPFRSCVVYEKGKTIVQDEGFDEFPFAVHRYRRFGRCVWGFGPGSVAKGDSRQLNFLNELADAAAEKAVFPPMVAPNNLEGEVGQGALEITYVDPSDPNSAVLLRELTPTGRYDVAKDRMQDKRQQVEQAFHVDLFQLFAARAMERQPMTATEANLVAGEKLTQFSPVFGRLVSEMLDPILARVFGVLLRAGSFGNPPASVTRVLNGKSTGVALPAILYKNRIMLAMQARQNGSLVDFMNLATPILQVYPEAADTLVFSTVLRDIARNAGLPEGWIRAKKEVEAMAASRADAAASQQELAAADTAAGVAQKLSSANPAVVNNLTGAVMQ